MNTVMATLLLCVVLCLFGSGKLEHIHDADCADGEYVNLEQVIYRLHVNQINQRRIDLDRTNEEQVDDILSGNDTKDSSIQDNETYSMQENVTQKNETAMDETELLFAQEQVKNDSDLSAPTYSNKRDNFTMLVKEADTDEVAIILGGESPINSYNVMVDNVTYTEKSNVTILTELVEQKKDNVEGLFREEAENITIINSFSEYDNLTTLLGEIEKSETEMLPSNSEKNGTYEEDKLYSLGAANYTNELIKQIATEIATEVSRPNNSYVEAIDLDIQGNLTQTVEKNNMKEMSSAIVQNHTSVNNDPEYNRAILILQEEIEMILNATTNDHWL